MKIQNIEHRTRLLADYWIEWDADILVLHRPDDSTVAAFSAGGVDPAEIERMAKEDAALKA
jgi:hypothetical protein